MLKLELHYRPFSHSQNKPPGTPRFLSACEVCTARQILPGENCPRKNGLHATMAKVKLTAGRIAKFQCDEGKAQAFLWCDEAQGLAARAISGSPRKRYIFESKVKGQTVRPTIGEVGVWNIGEAWQAYISDRCASVVDGKPKWGERQCVLCASWWREAHTWPLPR